MYNTESFLENETHEILWGFEMETTTQSQLGDQTYYQLKRNNQLMDFVLPVAQK